VNDRLGGQVQVIFAPLVEVSQQARADKLRALGITPATRSPQLPDVPTIAETLPGYEVRLWNGLFAPEIRQVYKRSAKTLHRAAPVANGSFASCGG
jgi:tripartite-type tricarboxylate transporter receptor subunit TctC